MRPTEDFFKSPTAEEFFQRLEFLLQQNRRPPEQQVLDETDLCQLLKIGKRTAANFRASGELKYTKRGGKIWYLLSEVLDFIERHSIDNIDNAVSLVPNKKN